MNTPTPTSLQGALWSTLLVALFCTSCAGAQGKHPSPDVTFTPSAVSPSPAPPGESTIPLSITIGRTVEPAGVAAAPIMQRSLPPDVQIDPAKTGWGMAYWGIGHEIVAFDLRTARIAWDKTLDAQSYNLRPVPAGVLAPASIPGSTIAFSRRDGRQLYTIEADVPAGVVGGVLFAGGSEVYSAFDPSTGARLWRSPAAGDSLLGQRPPTLHDGLVLQQFSDNGAILHGDLYAFDARTGHVRWVTSSYGILGYRRGVAYVDSTWAPEQLDNYVPMTISAIDLGNGKVLDSYTYAPDPARNAGIYHETPVLAHVAAGYVYIRVGGTWYRYDAERTPGNAHPMRFTHASVLAAFENGVILLRLHDRLALAHSTVGLMLAHPLPGTLRSPVVRLADGSRYAIVGNALVAFGHDGTPRMVGDVACRDVQTLVPWSGYVAVICNGHHGRPSRELLFHDVREQHVPLHIAAVRAPHYRVALVRYAIPSSQSFIKQWWVGPLAPLPNGGVAFTLSAGAMNMEDAIGTVTRDGAFHLRLLGNQTPKPQAGEIVADAHGTVWFNDIYRSTITALAANGSEKTHTLSNYNTRRPTIGIRLAIGPNGAAWYARSHPNNAIARADGSRTYHVPANYGNVLVLRGGSDGTLWFLTPSRLARVTPGGHFSSVPLPYRSHTRNFEELLLASGTHGEMWLARGTAIYRMSAHGLLAAYHLPNATVRVTALASGCNGTLYVAESVPQIALVSPSGTLREYPLDGTPIDGLVKTADCALWFISGSNYPRQYVGRLSLVRR
ncbi:MAG: virginiamycin B lyase family protein [Vulcanimicrobiaceae bacterium]